MVFVCDRHTNLSLLISIINSSRLSCQVWLLAMYAIVFHLVLHVIHLSILRKLQHPQSCFFRDSLNRGIEAVRLPFLGHRLAEVVVAFIPKSDGAVIKPHRPEEVVLVVAGGVIGIGPYPYPVGAAPPEFFGTIRLNPEIPPGMKLDLEAGASLVGVVGGELQVGVAIAVVDSTEVLAVVSFEGHVGRYLNQCLPIRIKPLSGGHVGGVRININTRRRSIYVDIASTLKVLDGEPGLLPGGRGGKGGQVEQGAGWVGFIFLRVLGAHNPVTIVTSPVSIAVTES